MKEPNEIKTLEMNFYVCFVFVLLVKVSIQAFPHLVPVVFCLRSVWSHFSLRLHCLRIIVCSVR